MHGVFELLEMVDAKGDRKGLTKWMGKNMAEMK